MGDNNMKKLLVILSMALISSGLLAQSSEGDYIKTNEATYFFKKIKQTDADNIIGIKPNGEKVEFGKEKVVAYLQKGIYYQKMPVYENDVPTGEKDLMKLIETKRGMSLMEYKHLDKITGKKSVKYYVFKGDKFVVQIDDKNEATLTAYFDKLY